MITSGWLLTRAFWVAVMAYAVVAEAGDLQADVRMHRARRRIRRAVVAAAARADEAAPAEPDEPGVVRGAE